MAVCHDCCTYFETAAACAQHACALPACLCLSAQVMTSWPSEREAICNMIVKFGGGVFATVMDSYDYEKASLRLSSGFAQAAALLCGFAAVLCYAICQVVLLRVGRHPQLASSLHVS